MRSLMTGAGTPSAWAANYSADCFRSMDSTPEEPTHHFAKRGPAHTNGYTRVQEMQIFKTEMKEQKH